MSKKKKKEIHLDLLSGLKIFPQTTPPVKFPGPATPSLDKTLRISRFWHEFHVRLDATPLRKI